LTHRTLRSSLRRTLPTTPGELGQNTIRGKHSSIECRALPNESARTMADQDISQYLAYLLASAHRRMRVGLSQSIGDDDFTEEHWRILQVLPTSKGARWAILPSGCYSTGRR
jgi:hypothetical protein